MFPTVRGTSAASPGRHHSASASHGSGGGAAAASYAYPSMAYASMAAAGGRDASNDDSQSGHILTPRTAHALAAATRGPVSPSAARRSSAGGPASVARVNAHHAHAAAAPSLSHIMQLDHLDFGVESHPPSVSSPVRSLRTPAGLALSYEQGGRNAHAMRRDLMAKESPTSPAHAASAAASATPATAASHEQQHKPQPGASYLPSLISHVHFTPLMPLPVHYGLTATLNRTSPTHQPRNPSVRSSANGAAELSGSNGGAAMLNFASPNKTVPAGFGGPLVPLLPLHAEEKEASPAAAAAPVVAPPTIPLQPMHPIGGPAADKAMTAVQRQRAYRAALLTKALSKPAVVHSLDRRRVDDLKMLLGKRAQVETLMKRKILTDESSMASRATQLSSTKEALSNFFGGKRPAAAVLTKQNILRDQEAASEREASKSRLSSFLMKRPSVIDANVAAKMTPKRITFQTASEAEAEEAAAAAAKGADESPKLEPIGDDTVEEGEEADEEEEGATKSSAEKKLEASAAAAAAAALHSGTGSKAGSGSGAGASRGGHGGRKFSIFTSAKMASTSGSTLNKLHSFLENRPGYEDLMKKNIMMSKPGSNTHANPELAAHARKMSFSNLKNSVSKLLQTRPTMSDLKSMAKNLLNGMVRNQMARDAAAEEIEKERQERLIQEHHATAVDGGLSAGVPAAPNLDRSASSSSAAPTDGTTQSGISLEALQSNNLKIDELFAERRRLTEQKLRLKEAEEPGGLYMSGSNERGQTGFQGHEFIASLQCLLPLVRETVLQVACGFEHTLVRTASGAAYAYGKNSYGQLGLGDTLDRDQPYSMHFRGSPLFKKNVVWIAAGEKTSGIVAKEGEVFTMGYVKTGSLGSGINPDSIDPHDADPMGSACCRATPFALPELKNKRIHRLALGGSHGAALDSSGRLYTWSAHTKTNTHD